MGLVHPAREAAGARIDSADDVGAAASGRPEPPRPDDEVPAGTEGMVILATTFMVVGSTRTNWFAFGTAAQTAPDTAARLMCSAQQADLGPTRIVAVTRFVAGSIREMLGPPASATQIAPGVRAIPLGCGPTWIFAMTLSVAGSMRTTVFVDG